MKTPKDVVDMMMAKDYFSQWLGIEVLETGSGISKLKMTVTKDMLNGFGIAHGGITYSLAIALLHLHLILTVKKRFLLRLLFLI
jgi:uncharacterized protein (TIGR00369 family)